MPVENTANTSDGVAVPEPLLELNSDQAAPLASIFKLYVLLAVADAVEQDQLDWNDTLVVTEKVRSLPSGTLQNEPAGTEVTVLQAATAMIRDSDNTATDMLMQRLGRAAVEDAVVASAHHNPQLLIPFPTTREMFQLGWSAEQYLQRWLQGEPGQQSTVEQRRALLDELAEQEFSSFEVNVAGDPKWPAGVDWFASAQDVAAVHVALAQHPDENVAQILAHNTGVEVEGWDYVGYKGGSSLGVLTGSWLVADEDETYVVVMLAATEESAGLASQQQEFFQLAQAALELLPHNS